MRNKAAIAMAVVLGCVPEGNSTPSEAGPSPNAPPVPTFRPSFNVMTGPFEDNFDRPAHLPPTLQALVPSASATPSAVPSAAIGAAALVPSGSAGVPLPPPDDLGPNWHQAMTNAWRIENGQLCGQMAHNHGVWLTKVLPVNARIEFDAIAHSNDGDLKAEVWGDGQSHATGTEYNNATSYLVILGGWHNTLHAIARLNEHGHDRDTIPIDPHSDDPKERPVAASQPYHFKIERNDGKTIRWAVNGVDYLAYVDPSPLVGMGHDHLAFNDWEAKVCFDNVKVTPLP